MTLVAYPSVLKTTQISMALQWPQSTLVGEYTGVRQTLLLGYPRWVGVTRVEVLENSHAAQALAWQAQLQRGDAWTPLPLARDQVLPDAEELTVQAYDPVSGIVRVNVSNAVAAQLEAMPFLTDGHRVRQILSADAAGSRFDLFLWPFGEPLATGDVLTEALAMNVFLADLNPQYQSRTPDFVEPYNFQWSERVVA